MRRVWFILGGVMILVGAVWFLQGIRVLPGSFMRGSALWAVIGALVAIAGTVVLTTTARRRSA